jgi:hypothetical protein
MMNLFHSFLITQSSHWLWLVIIVNCPVSGLGALIILLLGLFKHVELIVVPPESISLRVLLLDELIVGNVSGQEGVFVGSVCALCDMAETGSELVFCVFAWNESAVTWDLSAWVG